MRAFLSIFCLAILATLAPAAHAQCVTLSDLLAIGADPTAQSSGKVVTDHLSVEWTYVPSAPSAKEASWTFTPSGECAATARLVVRPQRPGQDVVLKMAQGICVRDLRSELKSRKLT